MNTPIITHMQIAQSALCMDESLQKTYSRGLV